MDIDKPHDSFFKNVFGSIKNTTCFLLNFLPHELSSKIDCAGIRINDTQKSDSGFERPVLNLAIENLRSMRAAQPANLSPLGETRFSAA